MKPNGLPRSLRSMAQIKIKLLFKHKSLFKMLYCLVSSQLTKVATTGRILKGTSLWSHTAQAQGLVPPHPSDHGHMPNFVMAQSP